LHCSLNRNAVTLPLFNISISASHVYWPHSPQLEAAGQGALAKENPANAFSMQCNIAQGDVQCKVARTIGYEKFAFSYNSGASQHYAEKAGNQSAMQGGKRGTMVS
jgi:hypothetical protein